MVLIRHPYCCAAALCLGAVLSGPVADAQTLNLSLSPATITFAPADPDTTPSIAAPEVVVHYRVRNNSNGNWVITLLAGGDLTDGTNSIPISNVTWTAAPSPPFQDGTLSSMTEQTLASGSGNVQSNAVSGRVVFRLINLWSYNVGVYTTSVVFTLTAP